MSAPQNPSELLQRRLVLFSGRILRLAARLPQTYQAQHIAKQLTRCGAALAANYGEVRGAESRSDFIHKLRIVLKELNETEDWLELIVESGWFPADKMATIIAENRELCRIFAASIRTAGGFNR